MYYIPNQFFRLTSLYIHYQPPGSFFFSTHNLELKRRESFLAYVFPSFCFYSTHKTTTKPQVYFLTIICQQRELAILLKVKWNYKQLEPQNHSPYLVISSRKKRHFVHPVRVFEGKQGYFSSYYSLEKTPHTFKCHLCVFITTILRDFFFLFTVFGNGLLHLKYLKLWYEHPRLKRTPQQA